MKKQEFPKFCFEELKEYIKIHPSLHNDTFLRMVDHVGMDYYIKNPQFKRKILAEIYKKQSVCNHEIIMQEFFIS